MSTSHASLSIFAHRTGQANILGDAGGTPHHPTPSPQEPPPFLLGTLWSPAGPREREHLPPSQHSARLDGQCSPAGPKSCLLARAHPVRGRKEPAAPQDARPHSTLLIEPPWARGPRGAWQGLRGSPACLSGPWATRGAYPRSGWFELAALCHLSRASCVSASSPICLPAC